MRWKWGNCFPASQSLLDFSSEVPCFTLLKRGGCEQIPECKCSTREHLFLVCSNIMCECVPLCAGLQHLLSYFSQLLKSFPLPSPWVPPPPVALLAGERSKVCCKQNLGWEASWWRRLGHLLKPVMLFPPPWPLPRHFFFQSWPFVEQETSELWAAPGPYSVERFPFRLSRYLWAGRTSPLPPCSENPLPASPLPWLFLKHTHTHHCQKSPSSAPSPANFLPAFPELDNPRICKNRGKGKEREREGINVESSLFS